MKNTTMNRRTFLKVSAVAGSGLLVGCTFSSPKLLSTPQASEAELGFWVRIDTDDTVTLILPASEMGQQAHTGRPCLWRRNWRPTGRVSGWSQRLIILNSSIQVQTLEVYRLQEEAPASASSGRSSDRSGRAHGRC